MTRLADLERMAREGTARPWRWLSSDALVGDHGHRPGVLTTGRTGHLMQRGADGLLHALDCDDPNPALIVAAVNSLGSLLAIARAAQACVEGDGDDVGARLDVLAAALGEFERGGGT